MRRETRVRMEPVTREVYIADDGTIFTDRAECVEYEQEIYQPLADSVDDIRIDKLTGLLPIHVDDENDEYEWYKVDTEEHLNLLRKFYQDNDLGICIQFPDIVCIRSCPSFGYVEDYSLSDLMAITREFWEKFDYAVTFQSETNSN